MSYTRHEVPLRVTFVEHWMCVCCTSKENCKTKAIRVQWIQIDCQGKMQIDYRGDHSFVTCEEGGLVQLGAFSFGGASSGKILNTI